MPSLPRVLPPPPGTEQDKVPCDQARGHDHRCDLFKLLNLHWVIVHGRPGSGVDVDLGTPLMKHYRTPPPLLEGEPELSGVVAAHVPAGLQRRRRASQRTS